MQSLFGCSAFLHLLSSNFPSAISCSVCLGTLCLDGAGPLVSLAPSDSTNLLCASFNTGLNHIQVGQGSVQSQGSGTGSGGAGGLDIKVVARFWRAQKSPVWLVTPTSEQPLTQRVLSLGANSHDSSFLNFYNFSYLYRHFCFTRLPYSEEWQRSVREGGDENDMHGGCFFCPTEPLGCPSHLLGDVRS